MYPLGSVLVGAALLSIGMPCEAHHSSAMFDAQKSVTLQGTVKAFQWTNPHCWIQLAVPAGTRVTEWSIEMGSPEQVYRSGWRRSTLQPGTRLTVVIHPVRDGTSGGQFVSATATGGAQLGVGDAKGRNP
jgi:hypothetical protein